MLPILFMLEDIEIDELTYVIKGALFNVYNELGPGLFESVYSKALAMN